MLIEQDVQRLLQKNTNSNRTSTKVQSDETPKFAKSVLQVSLKLIKKF